MEINQNTNLKTIATGKKSAFRYWLEFLKPYHKLRNKEMEALCLLLYYRYELSREISQEEMVNVVLFSTKIRNKIREELNGMSQKVFNNLLTSLRKKKVLSKENRILPGLIPNMSEDGFSLIFNFKLDEIK